MCFWKNLAKFVGMKQSIDFLPERKQRDLHELVGLIRDEVKDVVMIILYGSYARNTYVELDIRRDYGGGKIQYMSDYDILVVSKKRLGSRTVTVSSRVKSSFLKNKNADTQTRPQIINESITKFNNALSEGRYFYVDILTEGIVLYDSGECQLATPCELNYSEILQMAEEYYDTQFNRGKRFIRYTQIAYADNEIKDSSFFLHQASESFLKSIPLVYILYGYKEHEHEFLIERCKPYTLELAKVFPCDTKEEERLFKLLQRAYIESRYNPDFEITKEDIDLLMPKAEMLRDIVEDVCRKQFDYYKQQSKKQLPKERG